MTIESIKGKFGEPDSYEEFYCRNPNGKVSYGTDHSDTKDADRKYHVEYFRYGAFGAHSQKAGHVTKYRLCLTFVDGKLVSWSKSAPSD